MNKITDIIAFYITNHHVDIKDIDLFKFGLKSFLNHLVILIALLIGSVLLHNVMLTIIFAISFFYMREFCGGLHFNSRMVCFCFSLIFLLFIPYLLNLYTMNITVLNIAYIFSILCILQVAPVDHINKKINFEQKAYFQKKLVRRISILVLITFSEFVFKDNPKIVNTLEVSVIMNCISMVIASIRNYLDVKYINGREEVA